MHTLRPLSLLLLVAAIGCGSSSAYRTWRDHRPEATYDLVRDQESPAVGALVDAFYGANTAFDFAALEAKIARTLEASPHSARAHEVAGYLYRLRAEPDRAWQHFMQASRVLDAPFTALYIWELSREPLRIGQRLAMLRLFEQLERHHPDAEVRHQATLGRIKQLLRLGQIDEALALRDELGLVDRFRLLGPFDNDEGKGFLTVYPPEEKIDLALEHGGRRVPIRWRPVPMLDRLGRVPLGELVYPSRHSVAYLVTWVRSDAERAARLRLSSPQPVRAWLNDGLVLSEQRVDGGGIDNLSAPVTLRRGWNKLLIKSARKDQGEWGLAARLTDEAGARLDGLRYSDDPHPTPTAQPRTDTDAVLDLADLGAVANPHRRDLLESRLQRRAGLYKRALRASQRYRDARPENLVAIHEHLLLLWGTGEVGKALDLLNQGVELSGGEARQLLVKRARFYQQKKRWDRALDDLSAVTAATQHAYIAEIELGQLYDQRGWNIDRCRQFEHVVERWPDSGWALRELGKCQERRGYPARARERYQQARALEPGQVWGLGQLRRLALARQDHDQAWELTEEILRLRPASVGERLGAAELRRKLDDPEGARAYLLAALAWAPAHATPYHRLGDLAYQEGDREEAVRAWRAALARDPDNAQLVDHLDFVAPEGLGVVEAYIPDDDELDSLVAGAAQVETFPGTQVLFLLDHEVTEVNKDGSSTAVVTTVELAVSKQGRDRLIRRGVPTRGKTKLLKAYAVSPEGERQEASSIRGGSVRFRSLAIGSVVVMQYVHFRPPQRFLPNHFVAEWFFEGIHRQHERSAWILLTPRGRPLSVEVAAGIEATHEQLATHDKRTFTVTHQPPVIAEPLMPPPADVLAQVQVSTVEGWEEYVQWERALLSDAFETNPELEQLARRLTAEARDPRDAFDRLFHHVAQEIRYQQDYENSIAGVRPHPAAVVQARGYGDCKDKAVLLIQLGRHVGLDIDFAVLRTTRVGKVRKEIPNQQFNHAIVYVPAQEGIPQGFFMDPTTDGLDMGVLRGDDQGASALVIDPDTGAYGFREIPYQGPEDQAARYQVAVTVDEEGHASAQIDVTLRGSAASAVRRTLRDEESARKFYDHVASRLFPGSEVEGFGNDDSENIWKPLLLSLTANVSSSLQPREGGSSLPIHLIAPFGQVASLATRRHPLRFGPPQQTEMEIVVTLPRGARDIEPPPDFHVEQRCMKTSRESEVVKSGARREVKVRYQTSLTCSEIPTEDYADFRRAAFEVVKQQRDAIKYTLR